MYTDPSGHSFMDHLGSVLNIAGTIMFGPLGGLVGSMIGSAISTAASGGSFGDFATSAGVSAAASYATGGLSNGLNEAAGFGAENAAGDFVAKEGFEEAAGALSGAVTGATSGAINAGINGGNAGQAALEGAGYGAASGAASAGAVKIHNSLKAEGPTGGTTETAGSGGVIHANYQPDPNFTISELPEIEVIETDGLSPEDQAALQEYLNEISKDSETQVRKIPSAEEQALMDCRRCHPYDPQPEMGDLYIGGLKNAVDIASWGTSIGPALKGLKLLSKAPAALKSLSGLRC